MNRLICFLTGGHRYADGNITTHPNRKKGYMTLKNYCIKCGKPIYIQMNIDFEIQKALAERNNR